MATIAPPIGARVTPDHIIFPNNALFDNRTNINNNSKKKQLNAMFPATFFNFLRLSLYILFIKE